MSTSLQVIIAVSLCIIAVYYLVFTVLTVIVFLKLRSFQKYMETLLKDRIEVSLVHLQNVGKRLEELSDSTSRKVEGLTDVIPELRDKLQEIVDLLDLVQDKMRTPLLSLVAALKIFSEKVNHWF